MTVIVKSSPGLSDECRTVSSQVAADSHVVVGCIVYMHMYAVITGCQHLLLIVDSKSDTHCTICTAVKAAPHEPSHWPDVMGAFLVAGRQVSQVSLSEPPVTQPSVPPVSRLYHTVNVAAVQAIPVQPKYFPDFLLWPFFLMSVKPVRRRLCPRLNTSVVFALNPQTVHGGNWCCVVHHSETC